MIFLTTLLLSVFITIALIPFFSRVAVSLRFVDMPNERKVHLRPIPRIGGLAMVIGAFVPIVYWLHGDDLVSAWLAGASVIALFGIVDDLRGLGPKTKFVGQIMAALIAIVWGGIKIKTLGTLLPDGLIIPDGIAIPLTIIAIVGVTNAINLADGLDGLAGGLCLLIFFSIGFLSYLQGDSSIGFIALAMGGSIFGFLKFNTFPASVFMGDTGSQLLGFSAITLSLKLTQGSTALSPLLPLLLLGLPVLDTVFVMSARMKRGTSPFAADRNHFHHRLLNFGLHHTESVLVLYLLQAILIASAYAFRYFSEISLATGYLLFSIVILYVSTHADRIGWHVRRYGWFDRVFKKTLRRLRDEGIIIKHAFRFFEIGMPLLFLFTCFVPVFVPRYLSGIALVFAMGICAVWRFKREKLGSFLRFTLYLVIPFVVYLSETNSAGWMNGMPLRLYNLFFAVFTVLIIVISKFSRRKRGFKSTPMDFLILFLAVFFPNLPNQNMHDYHTGLMAAKIIIFYFCYEVMLAELRYKLSKVTTVTLAALAILAVKGLIG
jgi:UDP-GlcNAc:undecaprenyl-phosphate GlcNAc-1-phosphate transferase